MTSFDFISSDKMDGEGAQKDENDLIYFKSNKGYVKLMNDGFIYTIGHRTFVYYQ